MKVICPECNYSNEIPDEKIPANAKMATCPKCQCKFPFRQDGMQEDDVATNNYQEETTTYEPKEFKAEEPLLSNEESQNPLGDDDIKYIPLEKDEKEPAIKAEEMNPNEKEEDIWNRLNSMSPDQDSEDDKNLEFGTISEAPKEPEDGETKEKATIVPFENMSEFGFFKAVYLTIFAILRYPKSFFGNMELTGYLKPILFYVLITEFQEVVNFIWSLILGNSSANNPASFLSSSVINQYLSSGSAEGIFSLLLFPVFLIVIAIPVAGFFHMILLTFGAGSRGFEATLRVQLYSIAPAVLCLIPMVGSPIGAMLSLAITIIGYKSIHKTSYVRVVLATFTPVILFFIIAAFYMNFSQPTL